MKAKMKQKKTTGKDQSLTMSLNKMNSQQRHWFHAIRRCLDPRLLQGKWREVPDNLPKDMRKVWGHCYIATEAAFHAFGKQAGFKTHVLALGPGFTHWWLAKPNTGAVIDLTHEQTEKPFDYSKGHPQPMFRGSGPNGISKRAKLLLNCARKIVKQG